MDRKLLVARGYDRIAEGYLRWRNELGRERRDLGYLRGLVEGLPKGARVLDLGCGPGVPYTARLSERFETTGVDISRKQLALARRHVPRASFLLADMCSLAFAPASFAAVLALYSIIHIPREEHESLLTRLSEWLRPGGRLLAVLGAGAWEGTEEDWLGATMFWSHFDRGTYLPMVQHAGFRVLAAATEPDDDHDSWHLFVLAEKPA